MLFESEIWENFQDKLSPSSPANEEPDMNYGFRKFSSLLLSAAVLVLGIATTPQAAEARHCKSGYKAYKRASNCGTNSGHRAYKMNRKSNRIAYKENKRAIKSNAVTAQRVNKSYRKAVRRSH